MRFARYRLLSISTRLLPALVLLLPMAIQAAADFGVRVRLSNGLSGETLAGERVEARRKNAEGTYDWYGRRNTDASGFATFSLESGFTYLFSAKPFGQRVYSAEVSDPGEIELRAGMLPVTLISGADGSPLANAGAYLQRQQADGGFEWAASGRSDADGRLVFEPPDLDDGAVYRLKAISPLDGSGKYSELVTAPGPVEFVVGNQPLVLHLVDGVTGQPVPGVKVVAKEQLADGGNRWVHRRFTDEQGVAVFDLDGLGAGRRYLLQSYPYQAGSVNTAVLSEAGKVELAVGTSPITLVDQRDGQPIAGLKLTAIEKTAEGRLKWRRSGTTDADGVVRFDLAGIDDGRAYGIRADDVFGQGKRYYSPWIRAAGPVTFAVSPDGDHALDIKPPEVLIAAPAEDARVSDLGFRVDVSARDDHTVASVLVRVTDPLLGASETTAHLDAASGNWSARIGAEQVSAGQSVAITAIAEDSARNIAETAVSVRVISDRAPPVLAVDQPMSGDTVPANGFFASGIVSDDTGIASFTATADTMHLSVEIAPATGRWAFALPKDSLTAGASLDLVLRAVDNADNDVEQHIQLTVDAAEAGIPHLLSRIGFGATAGLLDDVRGLGWSAYVDEQLNPGDSDPALDAALEGWTLDKTRDLQFYQLAHAVYSRWQLRELMTWFWDNHFNTYLPKHGGRDYELAENDAFRANALGYFRDLLAVSAKSPAMLVYLDQHVSRKEDPNENYARELLELHTLGVDGGYSAEDVAEVARAFTGWRVRSRAFYYDDRRHDQGEKQLLGATIPAGGGIEDGEQVLDILASHPATADYICTKLARLFIADQPPVAVVDGCSDVFLESGGNLRDVVGHLLETDGFIGHGFHAKVKTPLEMVASLARGLDARLTGRDALSFLSQMGMPLFYNPVPTGWAETGDKWVSSAQVLSRIGIVNRVAFNRAVDSRTHLDLVEFFLARGLETPQGVVDYLLHLMLANDFTGFEQETAYAVLNGDPTRPFDLRADDANDRLKRLVGTVLSFPSFQLQ